MKESLQGIDKRVVFRETFTDEASVRKNGGTPTAVTFSNGVGAFNGATATKLLYTKSWNRVYSIRIRFKTFNVGNNKYLFDFRYGSGVGSGTGYSYMRAVDYALIESSGTSYINGVASSTLSNSTTEVVITGIMAISPFLSIGNRGDSGYGIVADYELFEIYQGTLTANEVKNLYENKAYKELSLNKTQQLGSELIANGDMSSSTGWTLGTGVTIANGKCTFVTGSQFPGASQSLAVTRYNRYRITLTITDYTSGYLTITPGGSATSFNISGALGTFNYDFMFNGTVSTFYIRGDAGNFIGSIDNVSVKEILVDYTKEILNVDARNGVINNKLENNTLYSELIVNGDFDSTNNWTPESGVGFTVTDSIATITGNGTYGLFQGSVTTGGSKYRITIRYKTALTTCRIYAGSSSYAVLPASNDYTTYTADLIASGSASFFILPMTTGGIVYVDRVSCKLLVPSITNTSVTVKKDGDGYAMDFNPVSRLNCGSYDSLIGDKTFIFWMKNKTGVSTYTAPRFIDNGKLLIYRSPTLPSHLNMSSNGSTYTTLSSLVLLDSVWQMIVITRTFNGISNCFVNGSPSGTANQSSGTPVAGTSNITIGGIDASSDQVLTGRLSQVRIIDGILSAQEISQLYTNEKGYYNL